MIFGYCRISTKTQSLKRQIENIKAKFPTATIVTEVYTGTTEKRPAWSKLCSDITAGDTIVFDSVSRMSRCAEEGIKQYMDFFKNGVELVFLKEPFIDTSVYRQSLEKSLSPTGNEIADLYISATNKVFQILARQQIEIAFAQSQKEVDDLHQRTSEGMRAKGAPKKISESRTGKKYHSLKNLQTQLCILDNSKQFGGKHTDEEIARLSCSSLSTVSRCKTELKIKLATITKSELTEILKKDIKAKQAKRHT